MLLIKNLNKQPTMTKSRKYFLILFTLFLFFAYNSLGQINGMFYQDPKIDSNDIKKLYLIVDNLNFFKDNEYASEKINGYTLPGFRLSPKLSYAINKKVLFEVGVHMLHYWGANKYPCYSYLDIANWEGAQYQEGFHLLPLLRAQISLMDNLQLVFGNLYVSNNHNLILPLYNTELNLSSDPESGMQILYDSKYFKSDLWINWQSFIFKNDNHQEVFAFGSSSKTNILNPDNRLQLYIPLQFIVQHRGGELDIQDNYMRTMFNFAGGIGINYRFEKFINHISLESYYAGFKSISINCPTPFSNGYGIYNKLSLGVKDFNFNLSYWVCKDFLSIFGSPHFINISTSTENMVFNQIRMIHAQLEYCYKKQKDYSAGFEFNIIYYLPFTGYRTGYGDIISSDYSDFSFGLYLKLNPKFKLYSFRQ